jgi:hypothetical protein
VHFLTTLSHITVDPSDLYNETQIQICHKESDSAKIPYHSVISQPENPKSNFKGGGALLIRNDLE